MSKGSKVECNITAGGTIHPETQQPPIVMVALGTGLAPMRAMIQDRHLALNNKEEVGPMALFFGNRHKATENL